MAGTSNPHDVMTMYIGKETLQRHLMSLGITYPFGRVVVHVYMHVFSTALPVTALRVDSHGILHFVLVWLRCGFVTSFVWKISGMNFRNFATETAVFHFNGTPLSSFLFFVTSLPWTRGLVLELQTGRQFFLAKPDALIGKLDSIYRSFHFRDDFELFEVLGAPHFNTCGAS